MMKLTVLGAAFAGLFATSIPAAAVTLFSQDFESHVGGFAQSAGFVTSSAALGPSFGTYVFRNGDLPAAVSTLTFDLAQWTSDVNLTLSLVIIDSWDDGTVGSGPDSLTIETDHSQVFYAVFDNFQQQGPTVHPALTSTSYGSQLIGNSAYADATYQLSLDLGALDAGTHNIYFIGFSSNLGWQGGDDESYALDNIVITGNVPEPATWALMGLGLAGVGALARRRTR